MRGVFTAYLFTAAQAALTLTKLGIREEVLIREINYLARRHCVISEDFRVTGLTLDDQIALGPAGRTHLFMLGNPHYIAAISEDLWFREEAMARSIADRIRNPMLHFENSTSIKNAKTALIFLLSEGTEAVNEYTSVFQGSEAEDLVSLSSIEKTVRDREGKLVGTWAGVEDRYPTGKRAMGVINSKKDFGIFVDFEASVTGLLHESKCSLTDRDKEIGSEIEVMVLSVDSFEKKISLASLDRGKHKNVGGN